MAGDEAKTSDETRVFTDGAASGNPGPGGWAAIILTPDDRVKEIAGGEPHTTNNRMELIAAREGLDSLGTDGGPIRVLTDSSYVVRGATAWVLGWRRNGWKTAAGQPVANQDLWEDVLGALARLERSRTVTWQLVAGHSGIPENERADILAVAYTRGETPDLFEGSRNDYLPLLERSTRRRRTLSATSPPGRSVTTRREPRSASASPERAHAGRASRRGKAPYSYLSLVDGVLARHWTWQACEARVRGRSNARFRKAMSAEDEAAIARTWGVDLRLVASDPTPP